MMLIFIIIVGLISIGLALSIMWDLFFDDEKKESLTREEIAVIAMNGLLASDNSDMDEVIERSFLLADKFLKKVEVK